MLALRAHRRMVCVDDFERAAKSVARHQKIDHPDGMFS
jgi:hypothetical protein